MSYKHVMHATPDWLAPGCLTNVQLLQSHVTAVPVFAYMTLPADARFQNTGLERAGPVSTDIDNLAAEYSLQKPEPAADGPGNNYAK